MRLLIHKGIRPRGELTSDDPKAPRGYYTELRGDGSIKYWSSRELKSGCKQEITNIECDGELIYCPICDEWFKDKQFEERFK